MDAARVPVAVAAPETEAGVVLEEAEATREGRTCILVWESQFQSGQSEFDEARRNL